MRYAVFVIVIFMTMLITPLYAETISEDARKTLSEGVEIIKKAKGFKDYLDAEERFEKTIALSPQWADAYYNLALVSEELGKEIKAIKSYEKYLELSKNATDKEEILSNIERLKRARQTKREIGLAGINLIALNDGIYVRSVLPGSKLAKAGFESGDKIVEVNERKTVGIKLDEFYQLMKMSFVHERYGLRIQGWGKKKGISNPVLFQIIRGGRGQTIVASKDSFTTKMFEIEEDEIDEEVLKSNKPVLLLFWTDWCPPCRESIPIIEELADKYSNEVKILVISADFNKKASKSFEIKAVPYIVLLKNGRKIGSLTGKHNKEEIEELIKTGVSKNTDAAERPFNKEQSLNQIKYNGSVNHAENLLAIPILKNSPSDKIGMAIREENGRFIVANILPNSIAEKSGLKQGDIIVRMNTMDLVGISIRDFINRLQNEQRIILYIERRNER